MTKRSVEDTRRFHLFLYSSDLEYLERRFGGGAPSVGRLGVGTACREIIHNQVKRLRAKEQARLERIVEREYADAD
jgi:hypothetical protein